jgi:hypothetical protein
MFEVRVKPFNKPEKVVKTYKTLKKARQYIEKIIDGYPGDTDFFIFDRLSEQYIFNLDLDLEVTAVLEQEAKERNMTVSELITNIVLKRISDSKEQSNEYKEYLLLEPGQEGGHYLVQEVPGAGSSSIYYKITRWEGDSTWSKPGELVCILDPQNWEFRDINKEPIKLGFDEAILVIELYHRIKKTTWYKDYKFRELKR